MARFPIKINAMLLIVATSWSIAADGSDVSVGQPLVHKGINGPGKTCGHRDYTTKDFKYGQFETQCTRWILCESRTNCLSAGIDSVQACAEAAVKMSECRGDYIEGRSYSFQRGQISHCFCNPKDITWVPDTSHVYSNTYPILKIPTTTTIATTTTEHPIYSDFQKLQIKVDTLEKALSTQTSAMADAQDDFDNYVIDTEVKGYNMRIQIENATNASKFLQSQVDSLTSQMDGNKNSLADVLAQIKSLSNTVSSDESDKPLAVSSNGDRLDPLVQAVGRTLKMQSSEILLSSDECTALDVCQVAKRVDAIIAALTNLK